MMPFRRLARRVVLPIVAVALVPADPALADHTAPAAPPETFAVHGQATFVVQGVTGFASPYASDNSLRPRQVK